MNSSSRKKISNVCLNGALSNVARSSYFYFCFFRPFFVFAIGRSKTLDEKKMELKKKTGN
jgi:hypothetical protein